MWTLDENHRMIYQRFFLIKKYPVAVNYTAIKELLQWPAWILLAWLNYWPYVTQAFAGVPIERTGFARGSLCSNELHQPLCLRNNMPKKLENIPKKNATKNIWSVSSKNNIPGYTLNSVTTPTISRIKPTIFRTGSGIRPMILPTILRASLLNICRRWYSITGLAMKINQRCPMIKV